LKHTGNILRVQNVSAIFSFTEISIDILPSVLFFCTAQYEKHKAYTIVILGQRGREYTKFVLRDKSNLFLKQTTFEFGKLNVGDRIFSKIMY